MRKTIAKIVFVALAPIACIIGALVMIVMELYYIIDTAIKYHELDMEATKEGFKAWAEGTKEGFLEAIEIIDSVGD